MLGTYIPYSEYVLDILAWTVQHPDQPAEAALVIIGVKGAGKGLFYNALCRIFGQHALHISSPMHLTGRFNAHLRDCCLLFVDEAFWTGDKSAAGTLQRLITEPDLTIEGKGKDLISVPNRLHVFIAAEPDSLAVPAGEGERRYSVLTVSPEKKGDLAYFGAIKKQLEHGGYEAMLYDLLNRPLGDFHPRQIIRTDALVEQQARNLNPWQAWWAQLLETGRLPGATSKQPAVAPTNDYEVIVTDGIYTRRVIKSGLLSQARESSPKLKNETEHALGRFLRDQGCVAEKNAKTEGERSQRGWKFPPLVEAREAWARKFPGWPWFDAEIGAWSA